MNERRAICTWILPRGKRPNRSHAETKVNFNNNKKFLINHTTKNSLSFSQCC
jgi:hypothetical protein